jgi:hypothetical protein
MTPIFSVETLSALASRLEDHAGDIGLDMEFIAADLRLAAQVCDLLSSLRFRVAEIATHALERPGLALHRDLFEALQAAEEGRR